MCVYVKRHLDYRPHKVPTYILAQQQAAEKERLEKEKAEKERERLTESTKKEIAQLAGFNI